jgi:cysteine desulfurase/selenocysteine lyase
MNINSPEQANLPPGWPDVETLQSLANQFFDAVPGGAPSAPPNSSFDLPGPLGPTPAPVIEIPGEAELRSLLDNVKRVAGTVPPAAAGSYYFLEYAPSSQREVSAPEFPLTGATPSGGGRLPLDVLQIRRDFPILQERVNGRPLVWLDNAATTQKPQAVIDRLKYFYEHENSNIHRAAHELAARATDAYEQAREKVRGFLNASSANEIVFVRGATEAINLVAQSWGRQHIVEGDEILVTWLEHHANIVPWQQLATEKGARLKVVPVDDSGQVQLDFYGKLLGPKTKLVAFPHVSNALGTITPARQIIEGARSVGAKVLLDGAQAVSHMPVDVQGLSPDWYVFSGHKVFAPTGIGVLYGKEDLLNEMQPWQGGGNMIKDVTFERTSYQPAPGRFEAGTGNIGGAVGLGSAIDYVTRIGMERIAEYEHQLLLYATRLLKDIPGLRLIGTAPDKAGVLSFVLEGHRTEDIGSALNQEGIAVRAGHHCAQPILRRFGVESTVRPSLALYNTCADIDALVAALARIAGARSPVITPITPPPG